MATAHVDIARERTALTRTALSRPVARALEDGLIAEGSSVFDYGCGRGGDLDRLRKLGFDCRGYDPNFFPDEETRPADAVNLGYVVNVIEGEEERAEVLRSAWKLARGLLVVSARLVDEGRRLTATAHGDGVITGRQTFQKFFRQDELRDWIEITLGAGAVAAEPGVFYVFRDPGRAELFLLQRVRRTRPRLRKSDVVFDQHQDLLEALIEFIETSGRLPRPGEFARHGEIRDELGSTKRAFQVIKTITGEERWDRARLGRYEDTLVYLALSRFRRRPKLSDLPQELQYDIKEFFGSYKAACDQADRTLFSIGDQDRIRDAIASMRVGKRMPTAIYVHTSATAHLPVALRVLDGCARELLGVVDGATIVKIDRDRPRISYLEYPDFDADPHPALRSVYVATLNNLRADYRDYADRSNRPILHRKEQFVADDYPLKERFARLTAQEVRAGLFADPSSIGTQAGWATALDKAGVRCRGHRLVKKSATS